MSSYDEALKLIVKESAEALDFLNKELSLPNIPTPTMGGEVFWTDLVEYQGWRLQQNMFTHHARILRPDDVRVAWGTVNGMYRALDRLVESIGNKRYDDSIKSDDAVNRLLKLKALLDAGAITEEEFQRKKSELIDYI